MLGWARFLGLGLQGNSHVVGAIITGVNVDLEFKGTRIRCVTVTNAAKLADLVGLLRQTQLVPHDARDEDVDLSQRGVQQVSHK